MSLPLAPTIAMVLVERRMLLIRSSEYWGMGSGYQSGHLGSRFSTKAPMPSSASAASMFVVMTWLA